MQSIVKRTVKIPDGRNNELVRQAEQNSATQWLFVPFTVCDTTSWAVTTGLGKLEVGTLIPVNNVDETSSVTSGDRTVYEEGFRYARVVAEEVERAFPNRVKWIHALSGISDAQFVETVQETLLGDEMTVSEIVGEDVLVPNIAQMRIILRGRLATISKQDNVPQRELLLSLGKELDQALSMGIASAQRTIADKQGEIQSKEKASFDVAGKRAFLALGRAVPETLQLVPATDEKLSQVLDKLEKLEVNEELPTLDEQYQELSGLKETLADDIQQEDIEVEEIVAEDIGAEDIVAEVEPLADMQQQESTSPTRCQADTLSGNPCKKNAVGDGQFCGTHN